LIAYVRDSAPPAGGLLRSYNTDMLGCSADGIRACYSPLTVTTTLVRAANVSGGGMHRDGRARATPRLLGEPLSGTALLTDKSAAERARRCALCVFPAAACIATGVFALAYAAALGATTRAMARAAINKRLRRRVLTFQAATLCRALPARWALSM
jgi:hypothetical protein